MPDLKQENIMHAFFAHLDYMTLKFVSEIAYR